MATTRPARLPAKTASRAVAAGPRVVASANGAAPKRKPAAKPAAKAVSLAEQVHARLRAEIMSCTLEPGRDISEAELAARFAVSKTPVREALARLTAEGFVRIFPRRGYQVAPITLGDMNELFDLRTILEASAAEMACRRMDSVDAEALYRLADVAYQRGEQPSTRRFVQANRDFHVAIAQASGNTRLVALVSRTIDELERFFFLGAVMRDINQETRNDHREIVDVLRGGDPAAARAVMTRHNDVTRRELLAALSTSAGLSPLRF